MAKKNSRGKFIDQILKSVGICVITTGVFWYFSSKNQDAKDWFAIFGGFVTIIGFFLALQQLAKLRDEKEIIHDTKILERLDDIKNYLSDIIYNLSQNINSYVVENCIEKLISVQNKITDIKAEQCMDLDCNDFRSNINSIIEDLRNSIKTEDTIKIFNNLIFIERVNSLVDTVNKAKIDLTENIN